MALANFTLATATATTPVVATSTGPLRVGLEDLLYSPEQVEYPPQPSHEPFTPPVNQQRRSKLRKRAGTAYLPPPNQFTHYPHDDIPHNPYNGQLHTQVYQQNARLDIPIDNQRVQGMNTQYDNTGQYVHDPTGDYDYEQRRLNPNSAQRPYGTYGDAPYPAATTPQSSRKFDMNLNQNVNNYNFQSRPAQATTPPIRTPEASVKTSSKAGSGSSAPSPDRPRGFTKVETGSSGGKTQLHAVLDYDDDYYDDVPGPGKYIQYYYIVLSL
jgi:hypothetical protein